jgi:hypothetical protein
MRSCVDGFAQRGPKLTHSAKTRCLVFGDCTHHNGLKRFRHIDEVRQGRSRLRGLCHDSCERSIAPDWRMPRQHFIQDYSQRIHIGAGVNWLGSELLGSHVRWSANDETARKRRG